MLSVAFLLSVYFFHVFNLYFSCQIEAEATAVESVAKAISPVKIVLDRVLLTSTGVLLGCWQVISFYLFSPLPFVSS